MGFTSVAVIDDDLGRSGSGLVERPGFEKLVAQVCAGAIGAVFCIEASRLASNGRDWHHLIDLCALTSTVVIDHDGVYDPSVLNDRLLLGLKGTMSGYELSLLRQRGLEARDSKAKRGELRFALPPGYCWDDLGRIEKEPDLRVTNAIELVFRKFRELGSARQVMLWAQDADIKLPVYRQGRGTARRYEWCPVAYHTILKLLQHPIYAGAYVFGRRQQRTQVKDGKARKTEGHNKLHEHWSVLIKDNHAGYITWDEFVEHQQTLSENAHMQQRTSRKSGRGGKALLTGIVRCGRCGRMMRVSYGIRSSNPHRYSCRNGKDQSGGKLCIGIGGVRVDRAVAAQIIEAVSPHAVNAALVAANQVNKADDEIRQTLKRECEEAGYEASLAARRHEAVDPEKRLVAQELEARWNMALERVSELEVKIDELDREMSHRPDIDREELVALAQDLPSTWNAVNVQPHTKQRLAHILIREVIIDICEMSTEVIVIIHWQGGRHTEVRVARARTSRYPDDKRPCPVEVVRILAEHWDDRQLAVTMNRMRCKSSDGLTWTSVRVRELRERLGVAAFDPDLPREETIGIDETADRLGICSASVRQLIQSGKLPATQLLSSAPWQVPVANLQSRDVLIGVREIIERRPRNIAKYQDEKTLKLPGIE